MVITKIFDLVLETETGISCADITTRLGLKRKAASGGLTSLKQQGRVQNIDGLWYPVVKTFKVFRIQDILNNIEAAENPAWTEGYLTALTNFRYINGAEFDTLRRLLISDKH